MSFIHFTPASSNAKTGPIPVSTTSADSCPDTCPLNGAGCYAQTGPVSWHWSKVTKGLRGGTLEQLLGHIRTIARGQLWRHNAAGDLLHDNGVIDLKALQQITAANKNRKGFTYTHHIVDTTAPMSVHNQLAIEQANAGGFTVNLSANNLEHADVLHALNIGPVVTIIPIDSPKLSYTPGGRAVVVCPATYNDGVTCATCGVCQVATRKAIIGFPVHGTSKAKAHKVFMMRKDSAEGSTENSMAV